MRFLAHRQEIVGGVKPDAMKTSAPTRTDCDLIAVDSRNLVTSVPSAGLGFQEVQNRRPRVIVRCNSQPQDCKRMKVAGRRWSEPTKVKFPWSLRRNSDSN